MHVQIKVFVEFYVCLCVCQDTCAKHESVNSYAKNKPQLSLTLVYIFLFCTCRLLIIFVCITAVHTFRKIICDSSMGKQLLNKRRNQYTLITMI
jgi:hypothetical protein